jgi:hypothetical protein
MVHDAGSNRSILGQLGAKHKMLFMSSAARSGADVQAMETAPFGGPPRYTPLIEFEKYKDLRAKNPKIKYVPHFVPVSTYFARRQMFPMLRELPFEDWWESDLIFLDEGGALTRKKLASVLRNQEGGSHFDGREGVDPSYVKLRQRVAMMVMNYAAVVQEGLELATMRQIAEELKISLSIYGQMMRIKRQHVQAA